MPEIYLHSTGHVSQNQSYNCLFQTSMLSTSPSFLYCAQIEGSSAREKMTPKTRRCPSALSSSASRWGRCRLQAWHKQGKCGSHGWSWVIVIHKCKGRFIPCHLETLLIYSKVYLARGCLVHCYPPAASVQGLSSEESVRWFGSWWKRSYGKRTHHLCLNCSLWDRNMYRDSQHREIHRLLFHTDLISL